jgi:hypothetical protein
MKFPLKILFLFTLMCTACDTSRLSFDNVAELKASDDYEKWIPLGVVVLGATEIEASKHSGLLRVPQQMTLKIAAIPRQLGVVRYETINSTNQIRI